MERTLVLDQGYQPINIVPWERALRYIINDKVDVLSEYEKEIHFNMGMPAVVRRRHRIPRHIKQAKFSRQNVLIRDRFMCQYCGKSGHASELTFDHVVPRSRGGKTEWSNIVISCKICNHAKADRTPKEAGIQLRTKPQKPKWLPLGTVSTIGAGPIPSEWKDYWTAELDVV